MKIFFLMRIFWRSAIAKWEHGDSEILDWQRDPLSHPVLDAMGLDELADLPFDARSVCRQ
ncbi:hypothetical protein HQ945_04100 [Phyllobacterium sp. BT25]|uniref:Uncharacterized protein n=1 Tax=Phyllobacterium pellucidum TaxID=2740464 RepID=A0A849VKN5_9HYPH|nr:MULTISPECIES: hypothetical protein [Phyllobacterium]NTS30428.1 hypothetical protein [Phyllobacterium pellucidum]UGY10851.1 hypothetical protein LLE51_006715 [Phyllobacterium sp. T1018]